MGWLEEAELGEQSAGSGDFGQIGEVWADPETNLFCQLVCAWGGGEEGGGNQRAKIAHLGGARGKNTALELGQMAGLS